MASSIYADPVLKPKLDTSFYSLDADELAFFQHLTGIADEEQLKAHIIGVQAKAYEIYGYNCIRRFAFVKLKIARLPGYKEALKLLHERKDPILLDIGCCCAYRRTQIGNDARKAVVDGWPVQNVIASDLRKGFWEYGHELFKSTPENFPAAFVAGDVFDPVMLEPRGAFLASDDIASVSSNATATPSLRSLTSLTPLQGRISAIHASSFFHLFSEERQRALAHRLASLLSPQKGSVIFGQHGSKPQKGFRTEAISKDRVDRARAAGAPVADFAMFCHSPESWRELWVNEVFGGDDGKGAERIRVDAELVQVERKDLLGHTVATEGAKFYVMNWCVTRL
ncbi:hypothetical protein BDZ97DRAFT_2020498 [Flammula alnicola]|nr:hypothetical protein BDZ97DRAFT_2020498 [Flammula alnicola]